MEYPRRDFGSGREEEHHHHHHHHHDPHVPYRPPPREEEGYGAERYRPHPPETPANAYIAPPYAHHAPSPPGPYGTHASSGPYYPPPHDPAPAQMYPLEPAHAAHGLLPHGQVVRVFCKASPAFNLAVEHDTIIMKPANSEDEAQQWIKDSTYGIRVKDNYGYPAFSLVNKKTQKILKHAKQKGQQVLLMDYRPDIKDDDILWSESQDFGEGFKTVRSASDTLLNLTVFEGAKTIRNGSALVLDTWHKGDHQLWKLFPL